MAGPAEEVDGSAGEGVGEFEYLFDVVLGDADACFLEGFLDGEGISVGDDLAEELDFDREVIMGVEVGRESWAFWGVRVWG